MLANTKRIRYLPPEVEKLWCCISAEAEAHAHSRRQTPVHILCCAQAPSSQRAQTAPTYTANAKINPSFWAIMLQAMLGRLARPIPHLRYFPLKINRQINKWENYNHLRSGLWESLLTARKIWCLLSSKGQFNLKRTLFVIPLHMGKNGMIPQG